MTHRSYRFRWTDHEVGGELEALLARLHGETNSWEEVARRLLVEHGVSLSGQTLRRWARQLGLEDEVA